MNMNLFGTTVELDLPEYEQRIADQHSDLQQIIDLSFHSKPDFTLLDENFSTNNQLNCNYYSKYLASHL